MELIDLLLFLPGLVPEAFRPWLIALGLLCLFVAIVRARPISAAASLFVLYLGAGGGL